MRKLGFTYYTYEHVCPICADTFFKIYMKIFLEDGWTFILNPATIILYIPLHTGGPLFKGDIEDMKGKCYLMCPWHGYMFDVESGVEPYIGLQVKIIVHEIRNAELILQNEANLIDAILDHLTMYSCLPGIKYVAIYKSIQCTKNTIMEEV